MVYLDHAATTSLRPEAWEALSRTHSIVGNPASIHGDGRQARRILEESRECIAATLGCDPIEVIFTSGGTESINLAIKGTFWARSGDRIVMPDGEHHATLDSVEWLERTSSARIDRVMLDREGIIDREQLDSVLGSESETIALATMLWANNETGACQPVAEVTRIASSHSVPLHLDAVAAYGHVPIDFSGLREANGRGLTAVSVSAHKVGGPVGIGALVLAREAVVEPLLHGGGQQRRVRSGTQDVAAAAAFAAAADATISELDEGARRRRELRDRLVAGIHTIAPDAVINGPPDDARRLPGTVSVTFPECSGDALLFVLDAAGVSVSTGSACQAGVPEPSHVLMAMGRSEREARSTVRVTLGETTTQSDIEAFLSALPAAYAQSRAAGLAS